MSTPAHDPRDTSPDVQDADASLRFLDRAATRSDSGAGAAGELPRSLRRVRQSLERGWEVAPDPDLFDRIRSRLADDRADAGSADPRPWRQWTTERRETAELDAAGPEADPGPCDGSAAAGILRGAERRWEPTGYDGIDVARLALDLEARRVTMLVRMAPGSAYPPHRHAADEECLVLSGELHVGDVSMQAGDFQRADAGTVHPWQTTTEGCELLIVSSLDDELLETSPS